MFPWMAQDRMRTSTLHPSYSCHSLSPAIQTKKNTPNSSHEWVRQTFLQGELWWPPRAWWPTAGVTGEVSSVALTGETQEEINEVYTIRVQRPRRRSMGSTLGVCKYCTHTRHEALPGSTSDKGLRVVDRPRAHMPFALKACTRVGVWWRKPRDD